MNFDSAISFLSHSNWGFLGLWLLLLGLAYGATFRDGPVPSASRSRRPGEPRP
jgi:hypothetical protein